MNSGGLNIRGLGIFLIFAGITSVGLSLIWRQNVNARYGSCMALNSLNAALMESPLFKECTKGTSHMIPLVGGIAVLLVGVSLMVLIHKPRDLAN